MNQKMDYFFYNGKKYQREEFLVNMGMDAFRICKGAETENFTVAEVRNWMDVVVNMKEKQQ